MLLDEESTKRIIWNLFCAIQFLHAHDIVHGNLHPGCISIYILPGRIYAAKINDCGRATIKGHQGKNEAIPKWKGEKTHWKRKRNEKTGKLEWSDDSDATNDLLSDPRLYNISIRYAAPEVFMPHLQHVRYRESDCWSIGSVLFAIITGRCLFNVENMKQRRGEERECWPTDNDYLDYLERVCEVVGREPTVDWKWTTQVTAADINDYWPGLLAETVMPSKLQDGSCLPDHTWAKNNKAVLQLLTGLLKIAVPSRLTIKQALKDEWFKGLENIDRKPLESDLKPDLESLLTTVYGEGKEEAYVNQQAEALSRAINGPKPTRDWDGKYIQTEFGSVIW